MTRFPVVIALAACLGLALLAVPAPARDRAPSLRQLKQAVQENPQDPQNYFNLGLKYEILGKNKLAVNAFNQALKLKPEYPEALYELGRLKGEAGNSEQAVKDLKQALKLKPDYRAARTGLGGEYNQQGLDFIAQGQWDQAAGAFRESLQANPDQGVKDAARNNLGVALASGGNYEAAREEFIKALEADPESPNAHYNYGVTSLVTGNKTDAFGEYLILKQLDPPAAGELSYLIFQNKIDTKRESLSK
jgi:tetratricopeptide (TPR) repeat protein